MGRGDNRRDLADHVLAKFEPDERSVIEDAVVRAADAGEAFIAEGVADAMNRFNRKDEPEPGNGNRQQVTARAKTTNHCLLGTGQACRPAGAPLSPEGES